MNILLDMDGVMCNFIGGCCKLFNVDEEKALKEWPRNQYDVEPILKTTTKELWKKVDREGKDFWARLNEYSWSKTLYSECLTRGDVYFITAPSNDPQSLAGKLEWMKKFTHNSSFRNYLVGSPKFLCANAKNILIDDNCRNCNSFSKASGYSILFPQPWNSAHMFKEDRLDYVLRAIDDRP